MPRLGFQVKRFNKVEHLSINRNCLSYYFYRLRFVYIAQAQAAACQIASGHALAVLATLPHTHTLSHACNSSDDLRYLHIAILFHLSASAGFRLQSVCLSVLMSGNLSFVVSHFPFESYFGFRFSLLSSFCLSRVLIQFHQSNFPASFHAISLATIKSPFEVVSSSFSFHFLSVSSPAPAFVL